MLFPTTACSLFLYRGMRFVIRQFSSSARALGQAARQYETIKMDVNQAGVATLLLNRPKSFNSFNDQQYKDVTSALDSAASEPSIKAVVMSGTGKLYTAGMDLDPGFIRTVIESESLPSDTWIDTLNLARRMIDSMIEFPKLLIGGVNGHAIGVGMTTLFLMDTVYSVPDAMFSTPFTKLGIACEGTSSYHFPKVLGPNMTSRLLYYSEQVKASELQPSLIEELIPADGFLENVVKKIGDKISLVEYGSIIASKKMVRSSAHVSMLKQLNLDEMNNVHKQVLSPDFKAGITKYADGRKKK